MKQAIYLKINRMEDFAMKNMNRWTDVSYLLGIDTYILCDNQSIIDRIKKDVLLSYRCQFISSNKSKEMDFIISRIANLRWANAGYAHLTTFAHAREYGYDWFWNIDADDTQIFLPEERIVQLMKVVEKRTYDEEIDIFSLDMWPTIKKCLNNPQWSFGISYTKSREDWFDILRFHSTDTEYDAINIDMYFTYLRKKGFIRTESFYVENMKFVHYSHNIHLRPVNSYLYHWKQGKLFNPYMYYFLDTKELGEINIADEVIKIDIGIRDDETKETQLHSIQENVNYKPFMPYKYRHNREIARAKADRYFSNNGIDPADVICFGAGKCFQKNIEFIKDICTIQYVVDNDRSLWGEKIEHVRCVSPEKLKGDNHFVIVTLYSEKRSIEILKQLDELGVNQYITFGQLMQLFD